MMSNYIEKAIHEEPIERKAAIARRFIELGFSVLPIKENKAPDFLPHPPYTRYVNEEGELKYVTWKKLKKEFILDAAIEKCNWDGIGIICGAISGNLFGLDVDCKYDTTGELWDDFAYELLCAFPKLRDRFYIVLTPSGGFHIYYRVDGPVGGNEKLAQRATTEEEKKNKNDKVRVLIETRGEGGYCATYPTQGYQVVQGTINDLPILSREEHEKVLAIARGFNQYVEEEPPKKLTKVEANIDLDNPFKNYNAAADVPGLLEKHGWSIVRTSKLRTYLKRPGNDSKAEHSGHYNHDMGLFKVFSTSTVFEPDRGYDAAEVYSILECGGDKKEAFKSLLSQGYGKNVPPPPKNLIGKKSLPAERHDIPMLKFDFEDYYDVKKNRYDIPHTVAIKRIGDNYVYIPGHGYLFPKNGDNIDFTAPIHEVNFIAAVRDAGYKSMQDARNAITSASVEKISAIHILHHQIKNNPWDGINRITPMVEAMNLEGDPDFNAYFIRKMLLNIYAFNVRYIDDAIDEFQMYQRVAMILLSFIKGWGKTTFWRRLGLQGLIPKFFKDCGHKINIELYTEYQGYITVDDKKAEAVATNGMITNIDDIDNMLIKAEGSLRSLVSQDMITSRPLYTNTTLTLPRTAVYVGTSNNTELLRDRTENRWMVFKLKGQMDFNFLSEFDVIQLWSEVYHYVLEAAGKNEYDAFNFTQDDLKNIQESTFNYLYRNPFEQWVEENWKYDDKAKTRYKDITESIPEEFAKERMDAGKVTKSFKLLLVDGQEYVRRERIKTPEGKTKRPTYWNFSLINPKSSYPF